MLRISLVCLASTAALTAQGNPVLSPRSGGLGQPIRYEITSGRPFLPWLLFGVAYWPLALFHLLFRPHRVRDAGPIEEDQA